MRKYLLPTMVAASLVAFAVVCVAPARAEEEKTDAAKKPRPKDFTGEVVSVDAKAGTITVKNKKDETKTFTLGEKAKVSTPAKSEGATLADFKVGEKVHIKYREEDGKLVASHVGPPKPKKDKEEGDKEKEK